MIDNDEKQLMEIAFSFFCSIDQTAYVLNNHKNYAARVVETTANYHKEYHKGSLLVSNAR